MQMVIICLVIGSVMVVYGAHKSLEYENAKQNYVKILGKIGSYDKRDVSSGDNPPVYSYTPIIFYTVNNVEHRINGIKAAPNERTIQSWMGMEVEVYYDPNDPKKAIVVGDTQGKQVLVFGIVFTILSMVALVFLMFTKMFGI